MPIWQCRHAREPEGRGSIVESASVRFGQIGDTLSMTVGVPGLPAAGKGGELYRQRINRHIIADVVHRREIGDSASIGRTDRDSKRRALRLINVVLTYKIAVMCELHDFARVGKVTIDRVAIAGDDVSIRREC